MSKLLFSYHHYVHYDHYVHFDDPHLTASCDFHVGRLMLTYPCPDPHNLNAVELSSHTIRRDTLNPH